jgi:hypothetical protein
VTELSVDRVEAIAQAIHAEYLRSTSGDSTGSAADVSRRSWSQLPENLRASNRAQAADIARKLDLIGCEIVAADAADPSFAPTTEEVERLAEIEHQRWFDERLAAGWRYGSRDPENRTNPGMVAYAELDEHLRELDRQPIRNIPRLLAAVQLGVRRR